MSSRTAGRSGIAQAPGTGRSRPWRRVLVVYREGPAGGAALREGAEIAAGGAELVVVTLAPQVRPLKCCGGGGTGPYNCAVRDLAAEELAQARTMLGSLATRASFVTLTGAPAPPLAEWAAQASFDAIVLPAQRLGRRGGRLARGLRSSTDADIRLVGRGRAARRRR